MDDGVALSLSLASKCRSIIDYSFLSWLYWNMFYFCFVISCFFFPITGRERSNLSITISCAVFLKFKTKQELDKKVQTAVDDSILLRLAYPHSLPHENQNRKTRELVHTFDRWKLLRNDV